MGPTELCTGIPITLFLLDPESFKQKAKCSDEIEWYPYSVSGRHPSIDVCMKKCLEIRPTAFVFAYGLGDACSGNPKKCPCRCYTRNDTNGGCAWTAYEFLSLYKVKFKGDKNRFLKQSETLYNR